jgi:hypothetical protein
VGTGSEHAPPRTRSAGTIGAQATGRQLADAALFALTPPVAGRRPVQLRLFQNEGSDRSDPTLKFARPFSSQLRQRTKVRVE